MDFDTARRGLDVCIQLNVYVTQNIFQQFHWCKNMPWNGFACRDYVLFLYRRVIPMGRMSASSLLSSEDSNVQ